MVKSRKVFLKNGFAYVTMADFGSVLTHAFRTRLSKGLAVIVCLYFIFSFRSFELMLIKGFN